jgi:hypothetical protein
MIMNRSLGTLAVVTGGIVAGLFGSLIGNRVQRSSHNAAPPAFQARSSDGVALSRWLERRRSAEHDGDRLPQLEPSVAVDSKATEAKRNEAAADEAEVQALVLDPELARATALKRWTDALANHEAEAADPVWSAPTGQAFEADLRGLGTETGFRFLTAQCRTTTCSARLEWPDYQSALQGSQQLVHHVYRTSCGTATTLAPPPSGSEKDAYQMTMLYDCASARAGG